MKEYETGQELLEDNKIALFYVELGKVKDNDRSLVLITNGFLELLVEVLIKNKCKSSKRILGDNRTFPYSSKLIILNEVGAISDKNYHNLDHLRKLRNRAAHEPFFTMQEDSFNNFSVHGYKTINKLYPLCIYLIADMWDENKDVFTPIFAPIVTNNDAEQNT